MNNSFRSTPPTPGECSDDYQEYVDKVPAGDIIALLMKQGAEAVRLFSGLTEAQELFSYMPGKWTVRELLGHVNDDERLFASRALWFGRGGEGPLPSWQGDEWVKENRHSRRPLADLVNEFEHLRASSIYLFSSFDEQAWRRHGVAAGDDVSVRALVWITAGHVEHHLDILRKRYLSALQNS